DDIGNLEALAGVSGREPDGLNELGSVCIPRDLYGDTRWAVFNHANGGRAADVCLGLPLFLVPIHVPRRPLFRVVVRDGETHRPGQQFAVNPLVEDAADI